MRLIPLFICFFFLNSVCHSETITVDLVGPYKQASQQFQTWFNINVDPSDIVAISNTAKNLRLDFYNKLRGCVPGTYKYPIDNSGWGEQADKTFIPLYSLGTSIISGVKDGKCSVDTTRDLGNNEITQTHCEYSPNSLAAFTDKTLEDLSGNATVFIPNEYSNGIINSNKIIDSINKIQSISQQECKILNNTRVHDVGKIEGTISF